MKRRSLNSGSPLIRRRLRLLAALVVATSFSAAFGAARNSQDQSLRSLTPLELAIEKQKRRLGSTEVEERRDALMQLGALRRAEASRVALTALADPAPIVRATAAYALSALPAEESVPALTPLLTDKDEFLRQQVCYALGVTRSRAAVSPLVERLTMDKLDSVRAAAAVALGQIGDESAVVALAEVLSPRSSTIAGKKRKAEKNEFLLRAAAHSLGEIRSRAGVPILIETLANENSAADLRREAARSLGLIGDPAAVPALRAAALEADAYLSQIASEALRRIAARPGKTS
jgi:HEAT repeat protein